MCVRPTRILSKQTRRVLSTTGHNFVSEKAGKIGIQESMAKIEPKISNVNKGEWLRQGQKIAVGDLGVYLPDGTLKFQSEEKAIEFGRKKILEALNSANPHEVHVDIAKDGRILFINSGDIGSVNSMNFDNPLRNQIHTTMHGHPDFLPEHLGKGCTTAISTSDIEAMSMNKSVKKMIVYNSKGEYYQLTKQKGCDLKPDEIMDYLGDFSKDYHNVREIGHLGEMTAEGYARGALLEESYRLDSIARRLNELETMAEENGNEKTIKKIKYLATSFLCRSKDRVNVDSKLARFRSNISCDLEERASHLFQIATDNLYGDALFQNPVATKEIIQKSHLFWQKFAQKYGFKMETNFSHFS